MAVERRDGKNPMWQVIVDEAVGSYQRSVDSI
jgi:hypothetical protein